MRKSLTMICGAALLSAGLAACNRGGNDDDARLNNAATMLDDNGVFDTSADDAALNQAEVPAEEGGPANGTGTNAAAPAGNAAGNAQ
jgi:hypothetical protein